MLQRSPTGGPKPTTADMALKRANVLAQLDIERQRTAQAQAHAGPSLRHGHDDEHESLERRAERAEATITALVRLLEAAGLAEVLVVTGEIALRSDTDSLLARVDDALTTAQYAAERAEAA